VTAVGSEIWEVNGQGRICSVEGQRDSSRDEL
jgi:hypothetical protein